MNKNEQTVKEKYMKQGYKCLRSGAPDFVFFKLDEAGEILLPTVIFVEVKAGSDRLSYEQKCFKKILKALGLNYCVEYIDSQANTRHTTPIQSMPPQSAPLQPNSNPIKKNYSQNTPNLTRPCQTSSVHFRPLQLIPNPTK